VLVGGEWAGSSLHTREGVINGVALPSFCRGGGVGASLGAVNGGFVVGGWWVFVV